MKKKNLLQIFFSIFLLLSGCNSDNQENIQKNDRFINYNFKEPTRFPFVVDEVSTEIDIEGPQYLHQFIFQYRNKKTTQEIAYILSKVLKEHEKIDNKENMKEIKLINGITAFYEEDTTTQTIWWKREDGFLARFVYFINASSSELKENKLNPEELVKLANEVQ